MRPKHPLDATSRNGRSFYARLAAAASSLFLLTGCEQNTFVPPPPPKVEVASPLQKPVRRYLEATGNTAAIRNVIGGAAVVVEENALTASALTDALAALLGDVDRRRRMSEAAAKLARPDAAARIADRVTELAHAR